MRIIRHPVVRLIIAVVCAFISLGLLRSLLGNWGRGDLVKERLDVLEQVKQRRAELEKKLEIATSSSFVEKEARNRLGLIKEGESIILLGSSEAAEQKPKQTENRPMSRWEKWWRLFF